MPGNIKNNNVRGLNMYVLNDEYWDFMLYKGEDGGVADGMSDECLASYIDASDSQCFSSDGKLISKVSWDGAVNSGVTLNDIGFTGVDNGLLSYDRDRISPKEFLDIFTNTTMNIESGKTEFFLSPITGNTKQHDYSMERIEEESGDTYIKMNGGFYQGFFKLDGFAYQTLPSAIDDAFQFEFTLRRRSDYETAENAVNNTHPENAGIFFYIGTRAENKFAEIYNGTYDNKASFEAMGECNPINGRYEKDCDNFLGDYILDETDENVDLSSVELETSDGHSDAQQGSFEIATDNKFLFFNRTRTGFTTHDYDGETVVLEGENREYIDNPFLLFNRTCTGYTTRDYEKITRPVSSSSSGGTYDMTKDGRSNAFALKINDDGSIGYRYTVKDCDADEGYSVIEASSMPGLIPDNEWVTINVRMEALNGYVDACGNNVPSERKMKLYIYLNGLLVFISKELPMLNLKALDEVSTKQEGVPYNISLGGGTLGLHERIWLNYYDVEKNVYPLEENYCGTFIGDFKSFKMYSCKMNISEIRANYKYEKSLLWEK